jgi:competence protein ComEC
MKDKIRAYPMLLLLLPLVVAILFCERFGVFYPPEYTQYDSLMVYTFVIQSDAKPTTKCERFEAETTCGKVYLYIARDNAVTLPSRGDTLVAVTRLNRPDSIGSFDYRKYLLRQGIVGTAYIRPKSILDYRKNSSPVSVPLQKRLYQRLSEGGLEGDELATVGALTLGYKEDLDPELKRHFQASGAAHVLAVSGLHTGIIYGILLWLLTLGGRYKPLYENRLGKALLSLAIISLMWAYAWLTGMTPSVVRAVLMVTIVEVGKILRRNSLTVNSIATAAVFILLVKPLDLWSISFQLSFSATFAIVLCVGDAERYFMRIEWNNKWFKRLMNWILGMIIVSIAAQLGTMPITMYTFGQFSTYFLLTNLIVLPLAGLLVPCGLISILLGGSVIGVWFTKITFALAWLMNHSVGWIESLPGSTIPANVNGYMVAIYYLMCLIFGFIMIKNREKS